MPTVAVAILHGMGEQRRGYSRGFQAGLRRRLRALAPAVRPVFREIFWADVLSGKERQLLGRLDRGRRLDYPRLRRFIVQALGDAVAYQPVRRGDLSPGEVDVYARLHDRVAADLEALAARAGAEAPLVWVAHSLGTVVASNYIWDCQKRRYREAARSPLARARTIVHLVFLGSSLPLWSLRYRDFGRPIRFPIADRRGSWLCFHDPDDVLAWPVKPINAAYRRAVTADVAVNVGGILTSWNPLAHGEYWEDGVVLDRVAGMLAGAARAARLTRAAPGRTTSGRSGRSG
jgi:hypothetical protein